MRTRARARRGKVAFSLMLLICAAIFAAMDLYFSKDPVLPGLFKGAWGVDADGYYTEYDARIGTAELFLESAPKRYERAARPEPENEREKQAISAPQKPRGPERAK